MENAYDVELGLTIRRLRLAANMSQMELAHRIGIAPSHMANIEAGRKGMPVSRLVSIADAIGTKPGRILDEVRLPDADGKTPCLVALPHPKHDWGFRLQYHCDGVAY